MYYITNSDYIGRMWHSEFVSIHYDRLQATQKCKKLNEQYKKQHPRTRYERYSMHTFGYPDLKYLPEVVEELFKMVLELKKQNKE